MKTNQRGFIVLLFLAAALLVGGYVYTRNQQETESVIATSTTQTTTATQSSKKVQTSNLQTADLKTYNNPGKDYSISYPASATLNTSDPSCVWIHTKESGIVYINVGSTNPCGQPTGIGTSMARANDTVTIAGKQYSTSGYREAGNAYSFLSVAFPSDIKIYITYGVENAGDLYSDTLTYSEYQKALDSAKQILSTFKFIQVTSTMQANSISDWKMYNDTQYRFTFSYPSDFALSTQLTFAETPLSYSISCDTKDVSSGDRACLYYIGGQTSDGFEAADFEVSASASTTATDCTKTIQRYVGGPTTQQKSLNGFIYYVDKVGGAGLGHYISTDQYRTYRNGVCYTIALNVASNAGASEKGLNSTFSNMISAKLQSILSSFKFIQ